MEVCGAESWLVHIDRQLLQDEILDVGHDFQTRFGALARWATGPEQRLKPWTASAGALLKPEQALLQAPKSVERLALAKSRRASQNKRRPQPQESRKVRRSRVLVERSCNAPGVEWYE